MTDAPYFYRTDRPVIIGHRGSFSHFPEHSLAGYADAYYGGTDWIELDLQITKDGQLVAQHDPFLDVTTDVLQYAELFQDRHKKPFDDFHYYVKDFTMTELKLFKRKQRYTNRSQLPNDTYGMASLQEVIDFVQTMTQNTPRVTN